jgi:hypothetical protein
MVRDHDYVSMADYEQDTRDLAERSAAIIEDLKRQIREREIMMWAMVRAAGGTLLVRHGDVAAGYPAAWRIDDAAAEMGQTFTITKS